MFKFFMHVCDGITGSNAICASPEAMQWKNLACMQVHTPVNTPRNKHLASHTPRQTAAITVFMINTHAPPRLLPEARFKR